MLDELNGVTVAVALMRVEVLSERWPEAELPIVEVEKHLSRLRRMVVDQHRAALKRRD